MRLYLIYMFLVKYWLYQLCVFAIITSSVTVCHSMFFRLSYIIEVIDICIQIEVHEYMDFAKGSSTSDCDLVRIITLVHAC